MTRRFASFVLATILILAGTAGMAAAQGRGRGGSAGAGRAAPAARMGTAARAVRPSVSVGAQVYNRRIPGAAVSHVGRAGMGYIRRSVPYVPFVPSYPAVYPYVWPSPYYTVPGYIDPVYGGPPYSPYVDSSPSQSELDLEYEVDRLAQEVERLRQEQINAAARPAPPPPPPPVPTVPPPPPIPITLVFRDGRQASIVNYAIAGQTLWIMDEQRPAKVALSDLDLDATSQANPGRAMYLPGKIGSASAR